MHNTPDYRGVFLRGLGSITYSQINGSLNSVTATTYSSNDLGNIQGDSMRKIYGRFNSSPDGFGETYRMVFDSSLVIPTDNEIRPVNKAVRYFIKAK